MSVVICHPPHAPPGERGPASFLDVTGQRQLFFLADRGGGVVGYGGTVVVGGGGGVCGWRDEGLCFCDRGREVWMQLRILRPGGPVVKF